MAPGHGVGASPAWLHCHHRAGASAPATRCPSDACTPDALVTPRSKTLQVLGHTPLHSSSITREHSTPESSSPSTRESESTDAAHCSTNQQHSTSSKPSPACAPRIPTPSPQPESPTPSPQPESLLHGGSWAQCGSTVGPSMQQTLRAELAGARGAHTLCSSLDTWVWHQEQQPHSSMHATRTTAAARAAAPPQPQLPRQEPQLRLEPLAAR